MNKLITSIIIFLSFSTACVAEIYSSQMDGDWDNPNIWSPTGVPGPADQVILNDEVTIQSGQVQQCSTISIQNMAILHIPTTAALTTDNFLINPGGTCDLDGTLTVNSDMTSYGEFFLDGTLQGNAPKAIGLSGMLHWNDGTLSGDTLQIGASAGILMASPSTTHTNNAVIINNGLITWNSGSMNGSGALDNHGEVQFGSGLTIHIDGQAFSNYNMIKKTTPSGALYFGGGSGSFNNYGTFEVTQMVLNPMASVLVYFDQDGTHTGTFETDGTAEFEFAGGSHVFSGGAAFLGMGEITFSGANILVNINGGFSFGNYVVNMTAGTLNKVNNSSHIQFLEDLHWSGGAIGTAATTNGDMEMNADAVCYISGTVFLGTTLSTEGIIYWTGGDIKPITNIMDGTLLPGEINCYDHLYINVATDVNMIDITAFCNLVTKNNAGKVTFKGNLADFRAISHVDISDGEWEFSCSAQIDGHITISATGTFRIGGHTGEMDFVYQGSLVTNDHLIASSNGYKILFTGSSAQTLAGDGTIEKVLFDNGSGVTIAGDQTVPSTGSIEIPDELLIVDEGNLVVYGTMIIGDCGGLPCYIRTVNGGHLRQKIGGGIPALYPVGTMSSYTPAVLKDNSPVVNNDYSVSVGEETNYNPADVLVQRAWDIIRHEESSHADVTLLWSPGPGDEGSLFDRDFCHVKHYNTMGGIWEDLTLNAPATPEGVLYSRTAPDVQDFSPFIVSSEPSFLPIELLYFSGKLENGKSLLEWATATETQNKGFEIEKSNDAVDFQNIGFVPGHGSTTSSQYYHFEDRSFDGAAYYRLRQIDEDGHFQYSKIIYLSEESGHGDIDIYPNPATDFVYIRPASTINGAINYRLVSATGHVFQEGGFSTPGYRLDTSLLPQGIYFLECQAQNTQHYSKIMINR